MADSFKDLLVWKQAMAVAKGCYLLTKSFPKEELYGMTSQIRRASYSIPAYRGGKRTRNKEGFRELPANSPG